MNELVLAIVGGFLGGVIYGIARDVLKRVRSKGRGWPT